MAIQFINTGTSPNAGNGDTLRSAFSKVNSNFTEIQSSLTNISSVITTPEIPVGSVGNFLYYPSNGRTLQPLSALNWSNVNESFNIGNNTFFTATSLYYTVQQYFPPGENKGIVFSQYHNDSDSNNFNFLRSRGTLSSPLNVEKNDQIIDITFISRFNNTNTTNLVLTVEIVNTSTVEPAADLIFFTNSGTGLTETVRLTSTGSWKIDKLDAHTTGSNITVYTGLIPSIDLAYDLGSTSSQWRSLYVGTGTIYIGGVPITINTVSNTLIVGAEPGAPPTTSTNLATESYVIDYVIQNSGSNLEIDGGFASTDYTAEIDIDGGTA